MALVSDLIIYVWLFPLALQILLPLGMLSIWMVGRLFGNAKSKEKSVDAVAPRAA